MMLYLQATADLLRRYAQVFRSAWSIREALDSPRRTGDELDFLPSSLELVEKPPHPAPRWTLRILVALSVAILAVAIFGHLDIVATAKGKVLPSDRVKVIQPAITGVARRILVHDGQRVQAGQLLLELDTTQAAADSDRARKDRVDAELAISGARAALDAQTSNTVPKLAPVPDASPEAQRQAQALVESQVRELADKVASASGELQKRIAEKMTAEAEIAKLVATAPLARQEADDYRKLSVGDYVSKHDYLDKEQTALTSEHELIAQRSHANELAAAIVEQRADIATTIATFRKDQLDTLTKAQQELQHSSDDETKATTRQGLLSLTAPVTGTVQQLSVHTLGGVVTTAQTLMEIVPDDALEVEASIENKDVGFVEAGQEASVKVDAFPYTQYGFLKGRVIAVANDAVPDKKTGLVFTARIRLPGNTLNIHGKPVAITPGMQVTADIRTGKRSVAQYFLSPLVENVQESMRER
ncbi:HlyD family type I secretion periplasmic adaptor subunit [Paraburkholderia megapolitana]|uniref:Membrane fusion protein (MFP) family protein n=1 Tax=Paraburkholderia megapolitana TaxID=420953 RepID=A0A1I3R9V1_9BURK|nr:HlyD family type I secretion periplasmic adaptor subunit [Paraburkholderia megapolitana]QDQ83742.1 HlyD family type I secretion periplasmic adaptor subunit [Paraburkholderia megapolitana]SFJ42449.1 hemolysin D [Paraburkholderia megapolitana]